MLWGCKIVIGPEYMFYVSIEKSSLLLTSNVCNLDEYVMLYMKYLLKGTMQ